MTVMFSVGRVTLGVLLLVLLLGFVIAGYAGVLAYSAMLWATIGGLIVTDWWKWAGVAVATLPVWLAYRSLLNRWRKRNLHGPGIRRGSSHP